jgi:hypothetical protein
LDAKDFASVPSDLSPHRELLMLAVVSVLLKRLYDPMHSWNFS